MTTKHWRKRFFRSVLDYTIANHFDEVDSAFVQQLGWWRDKGLAGMSPEKRPLARLSIKAIRSQQRGGKKVITLGSIMGDIIHRLQILSEIATPSAHD